MVRPFAEEYELNFPVVVGSDEMADEFGGVAALPTTFHHRQGKAASGTPTWDSPGGANTRKRLRTFSRTGLPLSFYWGLASGALWAQGFSGGLRAATILPGPAVKT